MARPKAFDPEHALDRAVEIFWRCGYEATSVADLTDALGIGKGSLYATFGSKDALWARALDRYAAREGAAALGCLDGDGRPLERVAAVFARAVDDALGDADNRGCLVLNAAMERPADPDTAARVRAALAAMERAFLAVLREARDAGDLPAGRDPEVLARFLVSALNGVRVTAKATQDERLVRDAAAVALQVLA